MPPKVTPVSNGSERLELAKAISNVASKVDAFVSAVDVFKSFSKDSLVKLDLDIEAKRFELDDLKKEIEHKVRNGKIDIDVALKEYRRDGAVEMLKALHEAVIPEKELEMLKTEVDGLRNNLEVTTAKIRKEEVERREKAIGYATRNLELTHKADNATVIATSEQREREITNLKSTIEDLRKEINAQRDLTKSVAEAGRHVANATPQYPRRE